MQFPITYKTLREDAQTAEMELIATQYRGRARVLQCNYFVKNFHKDMQFAKSMSIAINLDSSSLRLGGIEDVK